jgi:glycosyltransferase involved in cell wall biosynthesis
MRILFLTPGTGSFYCGTCMRDNALAVALRRLGHDAQMTPMYLPLSLDEESAENTPLFYGGVNVYLQQVSSLFRKTPRWLDQLLESPAVVGYASKRAGMTKAKDVGEMTVSMLRGEDGNQAKELDRMVEWMRTDGKPDVVCLSNALLLGLGRRLKRETGAKVVCTLQGEDTYIDAMDEPHRTRAWETMTERARDFDAFIAVSRYHADIMTRRCKLDPAKVHVVYNGISLDGYDALSTGPTVPTLGYLARMCPPKGLGTLVEAYLLLRRRGKTPNLKLRVAGAQAGNDAEYVEGLRAKLRAEGVDGDAEFLPNVSRDEKIAFLKSLTVFSTPATYGESFGLYVIEALAAGVPVVQPRHAVFPELLAETGGGFLCEPDSPPALADAIEALLCDPERARALGEEGRFNVREKFTAEAMARNVERVFGG